MSKSINSLKSYGKAFKVKLPKEPYFLMSYSLQRERERLMKYLREHVDRDGGSISVKIPMDNSEARLFSAEGYYYLSSDRFGKVDLNEVSTDYLGEQLYYSIDAATLKWDPSSYERKFDKMADLQEEWMHFIIANKEKRFTLNTGVPLLFSGYVPGEMEPGTIYAVYEKDGEHYVCVEGQEDIYWFDLNIDTKVSLCDELYREFLPQVTPQSVEDAITLLALECKSKFGKTALASNAKTPLSVLTILSEDKNEDVRKDLSANRNTPAEILAKLTEDPSTVVRWNVARNPNTSASSLARLAEAFEMVDDFGRQADACENIRIAVAENPNTPVETLAKLADDPSKYVKMAVSRRRNSPSFRPAADIEDKRVSENGRENPVIDTSIPADDLAKMALDPNDSVRAKAAENPNTPADSLVLLSKDIMWNVIEKVGKNPSTPLEVLLGYANTEEKFMRLVIDNPSFPLSSLLDMAGTACFYPKPFPIGGIVRALLNRL